MLSRHRNSVSSRAIVAILVGSGAAMGQNLPLTPQPGLSSQSECASSPTFNVQPFSGFVAGQGAVVPDSEIAVGPCHVLVASNAGIRAYNRLGQLGALDKPLFTYLAPPGPAGFWEPVGPEVRFYVILDPKVVWDPLASRWWASALQADDLYGTSFSTYDKFYLAIAVSKGSDPNAPDGWWFYRIDMTDAAPGPPFPGHVDLPSLAFDSSKVCIVAWDVVVPPHRWYAVVLDKQALLAGPSQVIPIAPTGDLRLLDPFVPGLYGALATKLGPMDGTPFYLIASNVETEIPDSLVRLYAIRQDQTPPVWNQTTVGVSPYRSTDQSGAPQPGGTGVTIQTQRNALFFWAVYRDGHLWAAHGVRNPNAPDPIGPWSVGTRSP